MSDKTLVLETVQKLSEEATVEEILEAIAIADAIRHGEEDFAAGRVVSHEEVKKRLATWISLLKASSPDGPEPNSTALELVRKLSDQATVEEILEEIAIDAAIRRGEEAADAGRVVPHDEVERRSASWIANL